MDLDKLADEAKHLVDERGGMDSLKEDAEELKDIVEGDGSLVDKAKEAAEAIKDPAHRRPRRAATRPSSVGQQPATPHAHPVSLPGAFNARRDRSRRRFARPAAMTTWESSPARAAVPPLRPAEAANVILLQREPVVVALSGLATYVLLVHAVADKSNPAVLDGQSLDEQSLDGRILGGTVSEYTLEFADGSEAATPVHRRLGIQQGRVGWGSSAFCRGPRREDVVQAPHGPTR